MRAEQEGYEERLSKVLAMMPDARLVELAGVLEQAGELSDEELEGRLVDVFQRQGEEDGCSSC